MPDLDEAIAFYRDNFGIVSVHEEVNEEQGVREAMLAVGDGSTRIQLLAPLSPESTIAKFIDRNGPGVQQVAYTVDDIDAVSATLRERGLRLLYDEPRRGTSDSRVNFVHPKDAGGVLVELVQPAQLSYCLVTSSPDTDATPTWKAFDVDDIRTAILTDQLDSIGELPVPDDLPGAGGARRRGRHVRRASRATRRIRARACTCRTCRPPSSARARRSSP